MRGPVRPPIVLLTDFGLRDHYAGLLKAVITSISPQAPVIDLCHGIEPQNVLQAASLLEVSHAYFPSGSIFVCVVDPGVGTGRKVLCAKTRNGFFIGPDNGVLSRALSHEKTAEIRSVENEKYYLKKAPSYTFHGRDIMSPVAARLWKDTSIFKHLGPRVTKIHRIAWPDPRKSKNRIEGEIVFFDHFGNAMTNILKNHAGEEFWSKAEITVKDLDAGKIRRTYASGSRALCAVFNSSDQLELAVPQGSAKEESGLEKGDTVICEIRS